MKSLVTCLEQYGLISLEKQEKFARLAGEHSVELDFDSGRARFSRSLEFPFQVLGTESDNTLTWLWAWAEEQTEIPADLITSALQMKAWGEGNGIPECTMPSVDLNQADGQFLSMIASEVCGASCFYQDAYEGGGLFLLLFGQTIDQQPGFDMAGFSRQFTLLISLYEFNHRNALRSYLRLKELPFTEQNGFITAELGSGEDIQMNFDHVGRLLSINGNAIALD